MSIDASAALPVALIGYGYAGSTFHAPLIGCVPGLRLAAVCSRNAARVHADWPDAAVNARVEEILQRRDIALVVIATPNDSHFDLARRALQAGKNVVVDKPFTLTVAEAEELRQLAQSAGLLLSVFHNRRWDGDYLTLRRLLAQGQLGPVAYLESRFERHRPLVRDRWRERAGPGGGLWYDLGPHLVDQALHLFGMPLSLRARLEVQRDGGRAVDYFRVLLTYPELRVVLQASTLGIDAGPRFIACGSTATYLKCGLDTQEGQLKRGERPPRPDWGRDVLDGTLLNTDANSPGQCKVETLPGDYAAYYRGIRDALRRSGPIPVSVDDAVAVTRIIELGIASNERGTGIALAAPANVAVGK
jgi:predicted dehydrogenase